MIAREFVFDELEVERWCEQADDTNELHHRDDPDSQLFDSRIVPGVMLLDKVSGLISDWAKREGGTPVLLGINSVSFEEPVHTDERVTISLEQTDQSDRMYTLSFDVSTFDHCASGEVSVLLEE